MSIDEPENDDSEQVRPEQPFAVADFGLPHGEFQDWLSELKSSALRSCARSFSGNVGRYRFLGGLPLWMASAATEHHFLMSDAAQIVLGEQLVNDAQLPDFPAIERKAEELRKSDRRKREPGSLSDAYYASLLRYADKWLVLHKIGLRQTYATTISGVYDAFEILAKDAWIAAVDSAPQLIKEEWFTKKKIEIEVLSSYGLDLRKCMGSLLAEKLRFDSLDHLGEIYTGTFPKGTFTTVFSDTTMFALSQVRNVIIHNSGIADSTYASKMKNSPDWAAKEGDIVALDAKKAGAMATTAIQSAKKLLRGVDQFVSLHVKT